MREKMTTQKCLQCRDVRNFSSAKIDTFTIGLHICRPTLSPGTYSNTGSRLTPPNRVLRTLCSAWVLMVYKELDSAPVYPGHRWCSGIMEDSHSFDPGSIPGRCTNFSQT